MLAIYHFNLDITVFLWFKEDKTNGDKDLERLMNVCANVLRGLVKTF